jgi:hypothetical protein
MNLVDLIVTVCLLSQPQSCNDRHLLFESQGSLRSCMFQAQFYLARWAGEHPGLKIVRWRCAWPSQEDRQS